MIHDNGARGETARCKTVRASDADPTIRLGCLRAAIELRSPGSGTEALLAMAALFYAFVTGARDSATAPENTKQHTS